MPGRPRGPGRPCGHAVPPWDQPASSSSPGTVADRGCGCGEGSGRGRARKFVQARTLPACRGVYRSDPSVSPLASEQGTTVKPFSMALPAMAVVFALAATVAPVRAGTCVEGCFSYECKTPSDWGCAYRNSCMSACEREPNNSSGSFSAIAYGAQSTASGWAWDKDTASLANKAALSECRKNGNDCEIVVRISSGCAAVAAIESDGVFAVGRGSTRQRAQSSAMDACASQHGSGCKIEAWVCS